MLMMVSVLVSAATMDKAIAHHGILRSAKKIIAQRALTFTETQTEQRDAHEIERDDAEVQLI